VQMEIERALARWEPRIRLESVTVEPATRESQPLLPADSLAQAVVATVTYQLVATQARERVSLSLQLGG
jgi:uncharacterized protein